MSRLVKEYISWFIIYILSFLVIELIGTKILKFDIGLKVNIIIIIISCAIASISKRLFKIYMMQRKLK